VTVTHHLAPIVDEHWQGEELAADDTHRYVWIWQGFNIRLIAIPQGEAGQWGYGHAWCYPRDPDAVREAVDEWDPDIEDEPSGWHKRPTASVRRAPNRGQAPNYNRPRCLHGCYVHDGCRTINCPDQERTEP